MKPDGESSLTCRMFEVLCVAAGLVWVLLICALGAGAALLGWRALDIWCERQLKDE